MTYDPKSDPAPSPNRATIKDTYEKLRARGEDDRAAALRAADSVNEQLRTVDDVPEFDPAHDDARSSTKLTIQRVYEELLGAGHDDRAAELRRIDTVQDQYQRATALAREVDA